jgi:hypothetical protein
VLSAALSGLAGSLKTLVLGFATLSDVHWTASGHVVLMTLVGGLGTLSGPLVGSAVVVLLENKMGEIGSLLATLTSVEWFNTLGESVTMVTGLIFVICVLAFRRGIMGDCLAGSPQSLPEGRCVTSAAAFCAAQGAAPVAFCGKHHGVVGKHLGLLAHRAERATRPQR